MRDPLDKSIQWYHCPPDGGQLTVPGYAGALTCPPTSSFCRREVISGVRFREATPWRIWAITIASIVLPVALLALCCGALFRRKKRHCVSACCRRLLWVSLAEEVHKALLDADALNAVIARSRSVSRFGTRRQ